MTKKPTGCHDCAPVKELAALKDGLDVAYLKGRADEKEAGRAELAVYKLALGLAAHHRCWGNSSVCPAPCSTNEQHDGKSAEECNKIQINHYLAAAKKELAEKEEQPNAE